MKRNMILTGILALFILYGSAIAHASTSTFDKQMLPILVEYLKIPKVLAADKTTGVADAAKAIGKLATGLDSLTATGIHAKHYRNVPTNIKVAAKKLATAADIAAMREALKDLSKPMAMWASIKKPKGVSVMYCSMAPGSWLQKNDTVISNPYYGAKMLRCGDIVGGEGFAKSASKQDAHSGHDH